MNTALHVLLASAFALIKRDSIELFVVVSRCILVSENRKGTLMPVAS